MLIIIAPVNFFGIPDSDSWYQTHSCHRFPPVTTDMTVRIHIATGNTLPLRITYRASSLVYRRTCRPSAYVSLFFFFTHRDESKFLVVTSNYSTLLQYCGWTFLRSCCDNFHEQGSSLVQISVWFAWPAYIIANYRVPGTVTNPRLPVTYRQRDCTARSAGQISVPQPLKAPINLPKSNHICIWFPCITLRFHPSASPKCQHWHRSLLASAEWKHTVALAAVKNGCQNIEYTIETRTFLGCTSPRYSHKFDTAFS